MKKIVGRFGLSWTVFAALGAILAIVLCFVPLFDIVGYESAAFYGVFYGTACSLFPYRDPSTRGWAAALGRNELLLLVPFAVLSLNAVRVTNCDYLTGLGFWLVIPVMSVAVATTLGWIIQQVVPGRRLPYLVTVLVVLASWADFGLRLALEPPIVGFNLFLGYFSGSIYDEALALPDALVAYRRVHTLAIVAAVFAVEAVRATGRIRRVTGIAAVVVGLVAVGLFVTRGSYGIDLDRETIAERLGGRVESEHFVIYYPATPEYADLVDRMVDDHEFRYAEMKAYFGTDPVALHGTKVRSFVYPNRETKGVLMGARRTLVAKIWLREMHIQWRHYGDHLLAHELAHVFTEPFGNGPLRLSSRWLVAVNMGLVEGIATAADWDVDELDLHQASAALRRMNKAPDITGLVGASGFWTQSSGRAYTLMGSFVQFLIDQHGIEKLRRAYGRGEFREVYGQSPEALVRQWEAFLDEVPLTEREMETAAYLYDRQSIFQKVCARTIADLRISASEHARAGDRAAAMAAFEQILRYAPDNVDYRLEYVRFLRFLRDYEAARAELEALLKTELDPVYRATVLAELGDIEWLRGDAAAAARKFEQCLDEFGLPLGMERMLRVKVEGLNGGDDSRRFVREYLVEPHGEDVLTFFPAEWVARNPDDPLAAYLLSRRLWNAGEWEWAAPYIERALALDEGVLRDEAIHMLIQARYFLGELAEAERRLIAWQPATTYYEDRKSEWAARLRWKKGRLP